MSAICNEKFWKNFHFWLINWVRKLHHKNSLPFMSGFLKIEKVISG